MTGKVFLVGAGPGDLGLVTLKAVECLKEADVVVFDRLAEDRLLDFVSERAELIYVGKESNRHTLPQEEINLLIVEKALAGKKVVRLKGGDPFVFGRGGEEAEELAERGIPFEVVPGITSAVSVPAYAGIPVTHRDYASSFAVVTGRERPDRQDSAISWDKLATGVDTLVFLMGMKNLAEIADRLVKNGRSPWTPVAVIRWGTRPRQQVVTGRLEDIAGKVEEAGLGPPAIIVVGEVVALRDKLNWFETRPLFGKRVLVTRSRTQASDLARKIESLGGEAVEFPLIQIRRPEDLSRLDAAINRLETFDWVVFTSTNAVEHFLNRMLELEKDLRALGGARLCAVGPATAGTMRSRGLIPDLIPESYRAEGLVEAMKSQGRGLSGERVLLPRSALARPDLPEALRTMGMQVTEVETYVTVKVSEGAADLARQLVQGQIDVITFTSSSTVDNFVDILREMRIDPSMIPPCTTIACIGPVTATTARNRGLAVTVVPEEATIDCLVRAILSLSPAGPGSRKP